MTDDVTYSEVFKVNRLSWFSAKVRLVILVEPEGATGYMDSIYLFRSRDYSDALGRAIELGKGQEGEYLNVYGQRVRWRLKEVIHLDKIASKTLDGVEVHSESVCLRPGESIPFDADFHPENSKPTETLP